MKKTSVSSNVNPESKIFILSLGQMIDSKFSNVIDKFSSVLAEDSSFGQNIGYYTNYAKTSLVYGLHELYNVRLGAYFPTIPYVYNKPKNMPAKTNEILLYKEGKISSQEFVSLLREKLNLNAEISDEKILDIWSSNFEISEENLNKIVEIIENAEKEDYVLAVVCSLDSSSYGKFLGQINSKLQAKNMKSFEENDSILTVKSFEENVSGKNTLARRLVEKFNLDQSDVQLVSLYRHITPDNIQTKNTKLIYEPVDQKPMGWFDSIPQLLSQNIFKKSKITSENISSPSVIRNKSPENSVHSL